MTVVLNKDEVAILDKQEPSKASAGGFEGLLVKLQKKLNRTTLALDLDAEDLERIPRYAFDYDTGGWEDQLVGIFGRTLGPKLGR